MTKPLLVFLVRLAAFIGAFSIVDLVEDQLFLDQSSAVFIGIAFYLAMAYLPIRLLSPGEFEPVLVNWGWSGLTGRRKAKG